MPSDLVRLGKLKHNPPLVGKKWHCGSKNMAACNPKSASPYYLFEKMETWIGIIGDLGRIIPLMYGNKRIEEWALIWESILRLSH